jgi:ferredoxin-NADP reductase
VGAERLPQPRRPLEGGALLDRLAPVPPVEQRAPGQWQIGTVAQIKQETTRVKSFRIELPMWMPHLPGQHYDVRLTAPDGYRAQRSYSVASSPLDKGEIELTIDKLDDGEVSPYFHDVVVEGDQVELRGPFASYFVWRGEAPVLLVGGGSGVVPLMAMLRHRRRTMPELPMRLVYSVRTATDVIYADEFGDEALLTFTRDAPQGWAGHTGRIDSALIAGVVDDAQLAFVCGSNGFVEAASGLLLGAGLDARRIRTERFGPTG